MEETQHTLEKRALTYAVWALYSHKVTGFCSERTAFEHVMISIRKSEILYIKLHVFFLLS